RHLRRPDDVSRLAESHPRSPDSEHLMLRIFHNTRYDFIKWWRWAAGATLAFIIAGLLSFAIKGGPNYSIEFVGGTLMQLVFRHPPGAADIRSTVDAAGITGAEIQQFGSDSEYVIRAQDRHDVAEQAAGAANVATKIQEAL